MLPRAVEFASGSDGVGEEFHCAKRSDKVKKISRIRGDGLLPIARVIDLELLYRGEATTDLERADCACCEEQGDELP